jgi:hypothetical protein
MRIEKLPILFCLLISNLAYSQTQDSLKFNNRKYKWEVGLDVKGILRGSPSSGLVFKTRKTIGKLVPISYSNNLRYLISLSGTQPTQSDFKFDENSPIRVVNTEEGKKFHFIECGIGYEHIDFYGRFNFYYGLDFGLKYSYDIPLTYYYYSSNGDNGRIYQKTRNFGPIANPFFGIKYRITERFSVSIETGFRLGYFFNKIKHIDYNISNDPQSKTFATEKLQTIEYNFQYLRFLTFNYHIKQF